MMRQATLQAHLTVALCITQEKYIEQLYRIGFEIHFQCGFYYNPDSYCRGYLLYCVYLHKKNKKEKLNCYGLCKFSQCIS